MELEQRIKTLEYEVKILKNEVQRTLLDIQEQVLIHYYPALRTKESGPSEGVKRSLESLRQKREANSEPSASPQVASVSLDEARMAQVNTAVSPNDGSHPGAEAGQTFVLELSEWIGDSVQKIGGDCTGKLIEIGVQRGWIAAESKSVLLRLAFLGNDEHVPDKVAVNDIFTALLKLNEILGRGADVEEALTVIEEADLG